MFHTMDCIRIIQYISPKGASLEPPPSSKPILTNSYEIHPYFITKVQELSFSGEKDDNPYAHLWEFKQVCSCLHILGMSPETLKWKLFSFSLTGLAKLWYTWFVESAQGEWEAVKAKFFLTFFPITRVVCLRREVLNFKQREKESLGASWACLMDLYSSGPDLALPEPILLQHFYLGLSDKSTQFLDIALGGAFLHLPISEGRAILETILENSPYTDDHHDSLEEKDNPISTQEDVLIAKSLLIPSKSLATNHIPEPFLGTPKEEEIHPLEFPFEFEEDLSPHVGNTFNHPIQQRSLASLSPNHHLPHSS